LASYAHQYGHAVAIAEWGGCNATEPYPTNTTSYAQAHAVALIYFDNSYRITQSSGTYQLTATGSKWHRLGTAIAAGAPGPVASVNSARNATALAAEAIASADGTNLATVTRSASKVPWPLKVRGTAVSVSDAKGISRSAEFLYV
jgi:hypothetical protein